MQEERQQLVDLLSKEATRKANNNARSRKKRGKDNVVKSSADVKTELKKLKTCHTVLEKLLVKNLEQVEEAEEVGEEEENPEEVEEAEEVREGEDSSESLSESSSDSDSTESLSESSSESDSSEESSEST